jgi:hypothetical protein
MGLQNLPAWGVPLSRLKFKTVTGAAAATNIAIAGIKMTDHPVAAINLTDNADVAELFKVTSAGNIQFPTVSTSTKQVLCVYVSAE